MIDLEDPMLEKEVYKPVTRITSYYVDNQKFSQAIHEYTLKCKEAAEAGKPRPPVSNYIGECFMKISEGVARLNQFNRYTWKEDMIADGIENCLRYVTNYNIDTFTRTSNPNAFYYFSKIVYYSFIRRIKKENRQTEIKKRYTTMNYNIDDFIFADPQNNGEQTSSSFVENAICDQTHFYSD